MFVGHRVVLNAENVKKIIKDRCILFNVMFCTWFSFIVKLSQSPTTVKNNYNQYLKEKKTYQTA